MAKPKLKQKARTLRIQGFGVKTIARTIGVSSSTVSLWCKDIMLSPEQIEELQRRARDPYYGLRYMNVQRQKEKRLKLITSLLKQGAKEVGKLTKRELFIAGIALYWAEGFKKDSRLGFANSDPTMIKFFLRWLIQYCQVPKEDIRLRVTLNISHKERVQIVEKHWSVVTNISLSQFQKAFFQQTVWKKEYTKPEEYFGVLRIRANKQLTLFRKIHGWIDGLKHGEPT